MADQEPQAQPNLAPESSTGPLDRTLRRRRPAPSAQFETGLRERLIARDLHARRPARLWTLVGAYAGAGTLLLALAAAGIAGGGPFG